MANEVSSIGPSRLILSEAQAEAIKLDVLVLADARSTRPDQPQLIIFNEETGCQGTCRFRIFRGRPRGRTQFVFVHGKLPMVRPASESPNACRCQIPGRHGDCTFGISRELDSLRRKLIYGPGVIMSPQLAAVVVMKIHLGVDVEIPEMPRGESSTET